MILPRLGRWSSDHGVHFTWQRIYLRGWRWTPFCRVVTRYAFLVDRVEKLREVKAIQGQPGNWDVDGYMRGMYNGLELAHAIMMDREPVYKERVGK